MQAVVLVNAAPGFEEAVEAALRKVEGVTGVARVKKQNYDLAALVDVADEAEIRLVVDSRIRRLSGVQGAELVESPSGKLLSRLEELS